MFWDLQIDQECVACVIFNNSIQLTKTESVFEQT